MSNGNGVSTQSAFAAMGHSRLVTNGTQLDDRNNQPVVKDGIVGVHNGIIVNVNELWQTMPIGPREYGIDTEVMFSLFRHFDDRPNFSSTAISKTCAKIFGTVATGFFADDKDELVLVTNNGSLYVLTDSKDILIFASERHILESLVQNHNLYSSVSGLKVVHVNARSGYVVRLSDLATSRFTFDDGQIEDFESAVSERYSINMQPVSGPDCNKSLLVDFETIVADPNAKHEKALLEYNVDEVSKLQRCTECVLPETFPFIFFDSNGACNYCNNYRLKNQPRPLDDLLELVAPYRSTDGSCDCIVPYSGGRDSTFTLHMVKKVLKLNPIAFTYDWGMVTDLARRNIARVCGRLGVENIIVAADIVKKRDNIRKNILAWLKRPSLGMIPLFMSGDKYFFYYTNQLKKQTGIRLNLWGINPLENTDFKTGFAGLGPRFDKKRIYSLSLAGQIGLFAYVGKNFLQNPSYLNSSNLDTLGSMFSRYMFPKKDYYSIFDYYQWNEKEIEKLILGEYEWEKAIDTKSTWRIGDGTASFYNYVYYNVAGFSEIDTFRSNQIREGLLTREEAMGHIVDENVPRYENLKWYLEIVGVDFVNAVNTINSIPKLYNSGKFERSLRSVAGGRP
ncbi:MAG: glucosamine 6-phosphate synthetase [Planctomycetota bacterium]|nr:glucosamine 6-phosphate synthetase [Planctomycetota bacterium]